MVATSQKRPYRGPFPSLNAGFLFNSAGKPSPLHFHFISIHSLDIIIHYRKSLTALSGGRFTVRANSSFHAGLPRGLISALQQLMIKSRFQTSLGQNHIKS